jgi:GxxExxY protein
MKSTNFTTNKRVELIEPELSYKIMGILFSVHNELGSTLLEKYYQRAMEKEFKLQNIKYSKELSVDLLYKDQVIGKYILDFIIEDKIILETKAQKSYDPKFFKQVLAYLKQTNLPLAILANFRRPRLEYKRIVNPYYVSGSHSDFFRSKFE